MGLLLTFFEVLQQPLLLDYTNLSITLSITLGIILSDIVYQGRLQGVKTNHETAVGYVKHRIGIALK